MKQIDRRNLNKFIISENETIREGLKKIDENHYGIILTENSKNQITGMATDGDIRRKLLRNINLNDKIMKCINVNFTFESNNTPRENILKKLDHNIRCIPILDNNKKLLNIIFRDYLPTQNEEAIFSRSRSPVRISFGGGGSDVTYYFLGDTGAVLNTTISLYSHATLKVRKDSKVFINSYDLKENLETENIEQLYQSKNNFKLITSILKTIDPNFGFELYLNSDYPMSSGLGGSAVVSATILGCFNELRVDQWDRHELSEMAFQAERLYLGVKGGWQDQYATVFGGFNFMEFKMDENIVHPLRLHPDILLELEESLLLCNTGMTHQSGEIHKDQKSQFENPKVKSFVKKNVNLSYKIRNQLLRGNLNSFGKSLDEAWHLKKLLSDKISNNFIDEIYLGSKNHGALGGKLLGAGGGGFFLFYVPPFKKHSLINFLESLNLEVRQFRFESQGLTSWKVRENKN